MHGIRRTAICVLLLFVACGVRAQTPHVYSQYFMNPYVYNPALAGVEGHNAVFLMYRQQWSGLRGAPQVGHVNWHTPLRHAIGIGVIANNDRLGPLTSTSLKFTTSYLVNLDRTHFFRFGLSLGAGSDGVDFEQLYGRGPLSARYRADLDGFRESSFHLIGDFGMMYHFGRFNVGVSLPHMLGRRSVNQQALSPISLTPIDHVFFKINYRQSMFKDKIAIEPHFLYRYSKSGNNQFEGSFILHIAHVVWIGASYRQDAGIIGLAGFKILKSVALGYAYDLTPTDLSGFAGATHEIHVGFHLGSRFDHIEHEHSFIKSERPVDSTEIDADSIAAARADSIAAARVDSLAAIAKALAAERAAQAAARADSIAEVKRQRRFAEAERQRILAAEAAAAAAAAAEAARIGRKGPLAGAVTRKGNHPIELPLGSYVIVGSFSKHTNAENYSEYLLRRGHVARVGYNSERGYFYVDMFYDQDVYAARARRDELRKRSLFSDAWVLTVIESK